MASLETERTTETDGSDGRTVLEAEGKEIMLAKGEIKLDDDDGNEKGKSLEKFGLTGRVYASGWLQNAWRNNFVRRLTRVVGLKFVRLSVCFSLCVVFARREKDVLLACGVVYLSRVA